ncbi:hypothetical protein K2X85_08080 [bacterium]|nr:hypothetical protein [bacterium]
MSLISLRNALVRADLAHSYRHRLTLSAKSSQKKSTLTDLSLSRLDPPAVSRPKRVLRRSAEDCPSSEE